MVLLIVYNLNHTMLHNLRKLFKMSRAFTESFYQRGGEGASVHRLDKFIYFIFTLRTVSTIVIAHTFCACRDTRVSYR